MINIWRKHGVRVYSDAIFKHIAGNGNYMYTVIEIIQEVVYTGVQKQEVWVPHGGILVGNLNIMIIMEKDQFLNFLLYPIFYLASFVKGFIFIRDGNIINEGWLNYLIDLNTKKEYI